MDFTKPRNLSANILELIRTGQNIESSGSKDVTVDFTGQPSRSRNYQDQERDEPSNEELTFPISKQLIPQPNKQLPVPTGLHLPPVRAKQTKSLQKKRKKGKKESKQQGKEVDIDAEIGQVAEWAENGMKNDFQDDEFEQEELYGVAETNEQKEIRLSIETKMRNYNHKQEKPKGGLLAKAEELKRLNQEKLNEEKLNKERLNQEKLNEERVKLKQPQTQQDTLMNLLPPKKIDVAQVEEDPWETINKQTINKYSNKVKKEVTRKTVLKYYKEEFHYDRAAVLARQAKVDGGNVRKKASCLEQLLSCFSSKQEQEYAEVQVRLIGISKKQLTNTDQQFFLLQQLWAHFQNKPFIRYGNHWNELGFQGRDPATDLRSTGVLSLLQWYQFCLDEPDFSLKAAGWMAQADFPFALTHIKATAIFLQLLQGDKNENASWEGLQNDYNSIAYGLISLIMMNHKIGEPIGSIVDDQAKRVKNESHYWKQTYKETKI